MVSRRPKVAILGTRFPDFDVELAILGDVDLVSGPGASVDEILELATGADVILAGAAPQFDSDTLAKLGCRAIVRLGVGVDGVDLDAARTEGVWVVNVPDYGTEAVALHAVTLILASMRRLTTADRNLRQGSWGVADLRPLHLPQSLIVGILGFGRIGSRVGEMLAGLGFAGFLVADPMVEVVDITSVFGDLPARLVSHADLMAGSDVVTLHAPAGEGYVIDADVMQTMKEGSVLVNTARGALIDSKALVEALARNRPGFAALDVFEQEPADPRVFEPVIDRVILTPHMSWYTEESELALRRQAAAEAARILAGETPLNVVVTPVTAEVR
ncbi:MAG TPA: NAD(P)-dependent oxidoreductase [Acidimicrobiia bacterium]|nr:NAD(P)-dependent oxidoreductase [Acidimicrobiia bacterium]